MDSVVAVLGRIIGRLPGPGKVAFGALTQDRQALLVLVACIVALLGTYLQPPVISLYTPVIQRGLRDPGSGVPLLVAAGYLMLAVLTLVGGASGDVFGRKRFILFGLVAVLVTDIAGMFLFDSPVYIWLNTLNTIAMILIMPMSVALVTIAFPIQARPFAYGAVFSIQGLALVLSSSFLSLAEAIHLEWTAFLPAIALVLLAIRLILRDVPESAAPKTTSRRELALNVIWASAIFSLVYGLLAVGGGVTALNLFLISAVCVLGFVIFYRWITRRYTGSTIQMYHVRDLSLAILAGIMVGLAQASFFYQIDPFFRQIQGLGAIEAGIRLMPYMLSMIAATLVILQLSMRFGARRLISGGLIVIAIGMAGLVFLQPETPFWLLIIPMIVMGFGLGVATVARTVVVLTAPPPGLTGMAAGINTAADQSGFTLGIILSSALVTYFADQHFRQTLEFLDTPPEVMHVAIFAFQNIFASVLSADYGNVPASVQEHVTALFDQAFTFGLGQTFLGIAVFIALAGVVIFFGMSKGLKASFIPPLDQMKVETAVPSGPSTESGSPAIQ